MLFIHQIDSFDVISFLLKSYITFVFVKKNKITMGNLITNRDFIAANKAGRTTTTDVKDIIMSKFKSVVNVEYLDTTSSAGDWSGMIVQQLKGKCYGIPFSIENRYPYDGFMVHTHNLVFDIDPAMKFNSNYLTKEFNTYFFG